MTNLSPENVNMKKEGEWASVLSTPTKGPPGQLYSPRTPGDSSGSPYSKDASTIMTSVRLPDEMKRVLDKELSNISVDRYYQSFWKEDSFLQSWLINKGKTRVHVSPWKVVEPHLVNPHDQETYDQVRTVTYSYLRSIHGYNGWVSVTMTQYCRKSPSRFVVVSSTVEFTGIPFAHAFRVQLRWIASRRKRVNLRIQVGISIVFVQQVLVQSQIQMKISKEMTRAQVHLFCNMKKELGSAQDAIFVQKQLQTPLAKGLQVVFSFGSAVNAEQVKEAQYQLARVRALPQKESIQDQQEQKLVVVEEMDSVHSALDAILLYKYNRDHSQYHQESFLKHSWPDRMLRTFLPRRIRVRDESTSRKKLGIPNMNVQPGDEILGQMKIIVSSTIPNISLQEFVDSFLTGPRDFYEAWLRETHRENIEVGPWQDDPPVDSPESIAFRRVVKCTFNKAKFLLEYPCEASTCTQIQEQRFQRTSERLIFEITTKLENVPFAKAFQVNLRWVVTELATTDLAVKIGISVSYLEPVMLENQINAVAIKVARRTQGSLLKRVSEKLIHEKEVRTLAQQKAISEYLTPTPRILDLVAPLEICMPKPQSAYIETADPEFFEEFENAKLKLRAVELFLKEEESNGETLKFILDQMNVVNDALDNISEWHGAQAGGLQALGMASFA